MFAVRTNVSIIHLSMVDPHHQPARNKASAVEQIVVVGIHGENDGDEKAEFPTTTAVSSSAAATRSVSDSKPAANDSDNNNDNRNSVDNGNTLNSSNRKVKSKPNTDPSQQQQPEPTPPTGHKKPNNRKSTGAGTAGALNKTYLQLCQEAIVALNDRTGSSLALVKKWILAQHPSLDGPYFAGRVNAALKQGLHSKPPKFAKIRASFKIAKEFKEAERRSKQRKLRQKATAAAVAATKKRAGVAASQDDDDTAENGKSSDGMHRTTKKKSSVEENNDDDDDDDTEEDGIATANRLARAEERRAQARAAKVKNEAAQAAKAAKEARAKQIAERLRRRRFPIEDCKLHQEDKEFGVKAPPDVQSRPYLPYFWHMTLPVKHPNRAGKTSSSILTASKVENLDHGSRGLVPDLLQIYHFFRGDVHFTLQQQNNGSSDEIVPAFSLQQLVCCLDQVQNGNVKRSKLVPPLLVHMFVTALQILLQMPLPPDGDMTKDERQLRKDFGQFLLPALSPVSWADITYLYMDAMERFYCTDASRDPAVLPPLITDVDYLFGRTDEPATVVPLTPGSMKMKLEGDEQENLSTFLPEGYPGYFGDERSSLHRAHGKLERQDPWQLTTEEIVALLRALTDDILATHPAASKDMAQRDEDMSELLKAKRAADFKFRKVRIAFEGPKRPVRMKPIANGDSSEPTDGATQGADPNSDKPIDKPFVPTATKKQFESAKKAQEKANDLYEKGIRKLVARTEPVGYDRNFNAVYCFLHDPEILYVEEKKPSLTDESSSMELSFNRYSWHILETTSLMDQFAASLDIRGRREHDLYEALVGPPGGTRQALRRFLRDDVQEKLNARNKIKEKESLRVRLEIARQKCDEEQGRRSGRLAGQAEIELTQVQSEIDDLEREAIGKKPPSSPVHSDRTGLEALIQFETAIGRVETRRTRDKKSAKTERLPIMFCSKLISTGNIDSTGLVGILVASLLELEEQCESTVAWERNDVPRSTWISRLESTVSAWNSISSDFTTGSANVRKSPSSMTTTCVATPNAERHRSSMDSVSSSTSKRRRVDSPYASASLPSTVTVSSIVNQLKQPLLELEERVAEITNVALASRDVDLADENMSIDGSEDKTNQEQLLLAWKKILHKLRQTPSRKHVQVREILVSAIAAARKAHVPHVVAELRAALLLYHPNAANDCKLAAIQVLVANGDFVPSNTEDDDSDDEGGNDDAPVEDAVANSVICAEAATLRGCLGGSEDASREDWVALVKSTKTLSRLASLTAAFSRDATEKLEKIQIERDALTSAMGAWKKAEERQQIRREVGAAKKSSATASAANTKRMDDLHSDLSEVWANVRYTDEICMAKANSYPWWPAKLCEAKDPTISRTLSELNRSLVAFMGEMGGLRVVHTLHQVRPFTGNAILELPQQQQHDDETENSAAANGDGAVPMMEYSKELRTQLDDCMTMARRIQRGLLKQQKSTKSSNCSSK